MFDETPHTTILLPIHLNTRVAALNVIRRSGILGIDDREILDGARLHLAGVPTDQLESLAVALRSSTDPIMEFHHLTTVTGRAGLHIAADAVLREHAVRTSARLVTIDGTDYVIDHKTTGDTP